MKNKGLGWVVLDWSDLVSRKGVLGGGLWREGGGEKWGVRELR